MKRLKLNDLSIRVILSATIVAGTFDIVFAIVVYALILEQTTAVKLLQFIASGVLGKSAFGGGVSTAVAGLALHYLIAFIFCTFYFLIISYIDFPKKHRLVSGILYGIFVWLVMNMIVLPATFGASPAPDPSRITLGMSILILAVGIPVAYIIPTGTPPFSKD